MNMQNNHKFILALALALSAPGACDRPDEVAPDAVSFRTQDACGYGLCMVEFGDRACCTAPCSEWDVPGCAQLCLDENNEQIDCLSTDQKIVVAEVFGESVTYKCTPRASYCVDEDTECVSYYGQSPQVVACDSCAGEGSACYIKNATQECSCVDVTTNAYVDCGDCVDLPCRFD